MKTYKLPVISFLATVLFLFPSAGHADMFGSDQKNWDQVFAELKKINLKLTDKLETQLRSLQATQADIQLQVNNIKESAIPALRGVIEQSDARMSSQINKIDGKVAELDGKVRYEIEDLKKSQLESANALRGELTALSGQLKQGLAGDMENLAKLNQKSFDSLIAGNRESLARVEQQLNIQNQTLAQTNAAVKANQDAVLAGFGAIDANNKKMIEVLSRTLQESQGMSKNVDLFGKKLGETAEQIGLTRELIVKLQKIFDVKLDLISKDHGTIDLLKQNLLVADEKITKLGEGLKSLQTQNTALGTSLTALNGQFDQVRSANQLTNEKIGKLIDSSKEIATHSVQLENKIDQSIQKTEPGLANIDLANEKLGKLIEILKAMAVEQGKVEQVVKTQAEIAELLDDLRKRVNANAPQGEDARKSKKPSQSSQEKSKRAPAGQ